ncbi:hypothetical protein [Frigoriglobus tundricola]|uniref:Putative cytochrome oxidase (Cbb3-type) n=1 Tax=Frigoriglobus tundricola TaxID=2774151 RepID=A0A6M5YKN7_9BACT|nr:hypothetical protein [Frigoriglobus tundricola]QJW94587.1 putative cytochrome oxidase (cbb3-type) [Frigoriglobus tundricola]
MKPFGLLLALAWVVAAGPVCAAPAVPGLAGKHPLSDLQVGQVLINELRCTACHAHTNPLALPERAAPDLADIGARVSPEYLKRFIAAPAKGHPGTTMPDLLASEPAPQRDATAEAIAHFLVSQSKRRFEPSPVRDADAAVGKGLFHSLGCVACHPARDEDNNKEVERAGAVSLEHVPTKYGLTSLSGFLLQPAASRPAGRMPDMKLTRDEARVLASFLLGTSPTKAAALEPHEKQIARGKEHFRRLNCAACHALDGIPPAKSAGPLEGADPARGCLSAEPGKGVRFDLNEAQVKAIRAALAKMPEPPGAKDRLAATLVAFNCIACHTRGDYGGVPTDINEFFRTSEKELGDDGRIPPPLARVGAKLPRVALKKVLFDGDGVRPYMLARMPQFGEPNLRHLPDLFAAVDANAVAPITFSLPKSEGGDQKEQARERAMRAAGRELVGDQGLNCVACHSFNGKASGKAGIELLSVTDRVQPAWFYHFLRDPNAFRPRTIMPTSWPGGQAVQKKVLDGNTDRQIEAIWYYLSLGTSAPEPSGVRTADTLLTVTDAARTYRGRSSVAGYRGIAVGFPEKLSYAFNAETGTLSALWRGDFVRVNRSGQGSGGFNPAGRYVQLAQDVSFWTLPDEKAAWPLRPVMTKDAPVNPDPLYPKNRGYQFKGYQLDDASVPTFRYRSGDVEIEDRPVAETAGRSVRLVRKLTFDAPRAQTLWFRALPGNVASESETRFKTPELQLTVPAVPTLTRPVGADAKASELLLKFELPKGQSTRTITYELAP